MIVLGIETSCDETAAAVVGEDGRILGQALFSQMRDHAEYGGVVPEIAARAHAETIDVALSAAMEQAAIDYGDLDAVAATCGPGLIGGVFVGAAAGKAIALVCERPFVAVNHLEGHALSPRLTLSCPFPYLLLLISGGHSEILIAQGVGRYQILGRTLDDALGEAFDKAARCLGLGYPGGAAVEAAARHGDGTRIPLPRPMVGRPGCDVSFSGLKTALRYAVRPYGDDLPPQTRHDLAAAFQNAVGDCLADRVDRACHMYKATYKHEDLRLAVVGGVAANRFLRARLEETATAHGGTLMVPPPELCTDNAVMIAWAGIEHRRLGLSDPLDFAPRPRWPLSHCVPDSRTQ